MASRSWLSPRRPLAVALLGLLALPLWAQASRTLDEFSDLAPWQAQATDDIASRLHGEATAAGPALCLDFDFHGVSGGAWLQRLLPLDVPGNFALSFDLRARMPANDLQLKLIDASGDNVWWWRRDGWTPDGQWQHVSIRRKDLAFAWGPRSDHALAATTALSLGVAAGQGGQGQLCLRNLSLTTLPEESATPAAVRFSASSAQPGHPASAAASHDGSWQSRADDRTPQLQLDLGERRDIGGISLQWLPEQAARRYQLQLSDDGEHWRNAREVIDGNGGEDALLLTATQTRYLRLLLQAGSTQGYGLRALTVQDAAWGATPNVFFQHQAQAAPRGMYPRGFSGQQSYWTLVGVDGGGAHAALISEDGAVEVDKGGWSIEPMLLTEHGVLDWATVSSRQTLADGYLPIPAVDWRGDGLGLRTQLAALGTPQRSQLQLNYTVSNEGDQPRTVTLALLARPFQVNPPTQFLNTPGGTSPIHRLSWQGQQLTVNGTQQVLSLRPADQFVASRFDAGNLAQRLAAGERPQVQQLDDAFGYAQGALLYRLTLPPHSQQQIGLLLPRGAAPTIPADAMAWQQAQFAAAASQWHRTLDQVQLHLPEVGQAIVDTARSALAQILMSRDGPALQPGTRSYARTWVRDGAMMSEGLLRSGQTRVVSDFAQWYAPHQFSNGKVPCCMDWRGADPVPENDSHGELIFTIAQLWRYSHDRAQLQALWPHVQRAVAYMDQLRASQQGAAEQGSALYGLMPASISHEGYSAKPMHSYWDDFWTLQGYDDAVLLAQALGHRDEARRYAAARDAFRHDLLASIQRSTAQHHIDYLPGAAELGDFDATSTTIALSPGDGLSWLPRALLERTFEKYWQGFVARRDGQLAWQDYTPYELRTVASFVRLGWRDRALQLLDFFFQDRRPAAWNQWAEVVGHDPRQPRFVGDMPHAWIASDYLRSAYDLLAYERASDQALVLAAGIVPGWLQGEGVGIAGLHTPWGTLSYTLRERGERLLLDVPAGPALPPGGLVLPWPYAGHPGNGSTLNGKPIAWQGDQLVIRQLPARVSIPLPPR